MSLWRWLCRLVGGVMAPSLPRTPRIRAMLVDTNARRLQAAAEAEGMEPDEFEDALALLATDSPFTMSEVLAMVEVDGLEQATARLQETIDGNS